MMRSFSYLQTIRQTLHNWGKKVSGKPISSNETLNEKKSDTIMSPTVIEEIGQHAKGLISTTFALLTTLLEKSNSKYK